MRRASLALASLTAVMLAACGGGQTQGGTTGGAGTESGTMGGDTAMAPGATTMDTAMTGTMDTGMVADTAP